MSDIKTLVITNFGGPLTRRNDGEINSGQAKYETSWGYDPYSKPGNLTWLEQPVSIMTFIKGSGSVTGIYKMKLREENGVPRVYGVGNRATPVTLYSINPTDADSPNVDTVSVIGTLNSSILYGAGMEFYGATEKIFTALQGTITKVNFDGSSPSIIGTGFTNRPMPMTTFAGKIYIGSSRNLIEIDSTETITNTDKLSPALPADVTITDLDVSPDGNYLQITASKANPPIFIDSGSSATIRGSRVPADSYKYLWNGIDKGVTALDTYGGTSFYASEVFGEHNYVVGNDAGGGAIIDGRNKISLPGMTNISAAATYSISETFGMVVPEYDKTDKKYKTAVFHHGSWDDQVQSGLYRLLSQSAVELRDVMFVPSGILVTAYTHAASWLSAPDNVIGVAKIYYSNTEIGFATNWQSRLWRFNVVNSGLGSVLAGTYETQNQMFSKKMQVKEIRFYTEPLVADNSFTVDLIGSGGSVMAGGSKIFTVGTNVTAGEDMIQWNPSMAPTYSLGVRITNSSVLGTKNWTGAKLEIDIAPGGK